MSGHNRWSNIRHRKFSQNNKKSKIFSKIIKKIDTFSKNVDITNIQFDKKLKSMMHTALLKNISKNTLYRVISKNIKKNDHLNQENMKSVLYEGYGLRKVAMIIECVDNNRNRIVSNIRNIFSRFGGNLINNGSITHLFRKTRIFSIKKEKFNNQEIINIKNKINADHFHIKNDQSVDIFLYEKKYKDIKKIIQGSGFSLENFRIEFIPLFSVELKQQETKNFLKLINNINEIYDVKKIYHNGKIFGEN